MTPPPTIIGGIMRSPWMARPGWRRAIFAIAAVLFAILSLWPEPYVAEAELMPQDSGGGLSQILQNAGGAVLNLGGLAGNKQTIEADLTISRSHAVALATVAKLHLVGTHGFRTATQAEAAVKRKLGVIAIRGSIVQITAKDHDPALAKALVATLAQSIQDRITAISLEQAAERRRVTEDRLANASIRLANAQAALSRFRLANKLPLPSSQLAGGVGVLQGLQAELQAKQVELRATEQVATGKNIRVQNLLAEIYSLQSQIQKNQQSVNLPGQQTVLATAEASAQYTNLLHEATATELLYEVYKRYLDEIAVDELSADQNLTIIEPAFIKPEREYNVLPGVLLVLTIAMALGAEYYHYGRRL